MQAPLFKGTLWKLNNDGNAQANGSKPACWEGSVGIYMFSSFWKNAQQFLLVGSWGVLFFSNEPPENSMPKKIRFTKKTPLSLKTMVPVKFLNAQQSGPLPFVSRVFYSTYRGGTKKQVTHLQGHL